jgi:hypothetical protein
VAKNLEKRKKMENEELVKIIRENFNKVFIETYNIREQNNQLIDHMEPTYSNVRNLIGRNIELEEIVKKQNIRILDLSEKIERLISSNN